MPLVVITGLPGEGSAQRLRDVVVEAVLAGKSALMVVPSAADAVRERGLLSLVTPVGARVATLDGLIQAEWALTGDGRRPVQGLGRDVLLARALTAAGVADHPGKGLMALLGMLADRATVPPEDVEPRDDLSGKIITALAAYRTSISGLEMIEKNDLCAVLSSSAPPADVIALDGFTDIGPEHEVLLNGWSASGADIQISLPWKIGCPGTDAATPLIERMRSRGARVEPRPATAGARAPELVRVREDLFTAAGPVPGTGAVSLAVTEGEEAEARHIAGAVAAIIAAGSRPEAIVIAFADPARRAEWLRRALRDAGVEADIEASHPVGETAMGRALMNAHACASGGLAREDVIALLRTPFSGVGQQQADVADITWRGRGPVRGRSLMRQIRQADSLIDRVLELRGVPIGVESAQKWKKLADHLLVNANPGVAPIADADGEMDAAVHRAFCRCLQEALELGDGEVSEEELWAWFATARVALRGARHAGRVLVTSIDAVSSGEFAHVIIGGLSAAEIPRRGSEDRLEGDSVSRAIARLGFSVDTEEHARKERRAFFLAAATATDSLMLTRQGTSDEGTPVRESVFWDEFLDLYRPPGDPFPTNGPPMLQVVTMDSRGSTARRRQARGRLADDRSLEALAGITEVSPSQVEAYIACPYRWFIERKIGAQGPDETVDRAAAGRFAHDALARFYREWRPRAPRVTPETRDAAAQVAAEAIAAAARQVREPETLEEFVLLDSVGPSVIALIERDEVFLPDYAPEHIEWEFGGPSEVPAVDIGGVSLKGRADRIDVGPEGLIVVDYKRSNATSYEHIKTDGLVQLQLYAVAASRALGLPVAGGLYRSLKDGSDRGFVRSGVSGSFKTADVIDEGSLGDLLDSAVAEARRVVGQMREGRIEPTPSVDVCKYCAASGFCDKAVTA